MTTYSSLRDAEAALRLINAARQMRGEGQLELTALDLARARTIRALDALLGDGGILLDPQGRRIGDESLGYSGFTRPVAARGSRASWSSTPGSATTWPRTSRSSWSS